MYKGLCEGATMADNFDFDPCVDLFASFWLSTTIDTCLA